MFMEQILTFLFTQTIVLAKQPPYLLPNQKDNPVFY